MQGIHLSLMVIVAMLLVCASLKPPDVHNDVIIEPIGRMWMKKSDMSIRFALGVTPTNRVVQFFCNPRISRSRRSTDYDPLDPDDEAVLAPVDDSQFKPMEVNWADRIVLGPVFEKYCKVRGYTGCVPPNTVEEYAELQRNITQYIKRAGREMLENEESSMLATILEQGVLPLTLRNDPLLKNITRDRTMRSSQNIDVREALYFAGVNTLGCSYRDGPPDTIHLSINLVDFRDALHGTLYEVLHSGAFNINRTEFRRMDMPRYIFGDGNGRYKFVNIHQCSYSGYGTFLCTHDDAVVPSACDLKTLVGCADHNKVFKPDSTGHIDVVSELGTKYVVATSRKMILRVSFRKEFGIPRPPSGIYKISLKQDETLIVGTKRFLGLDIFFDEKEHVQNPDFSLIDSSEESEDVAHSDTMGNQYFKEEFEEDDQRKHRMEPIREFSIWEKITSRFRERMLTSFVMSLLDVVVLFVVSVPLYMVLSKVRLGFGIANPFARLFGGN